MHAAFARGFHIGHEVHARAAVQLVYHHAFGPVDDEFPAAEHDRYVAQVNFFLDGLLFGQAEPDFKRPAVGEAQLAAFVGLVPGFAQLVADVFQAQGLIVAFSGKDFPQYALDPLVFTLLPGYVVLQECLVTDGLNLRQIRNKMRGPAAAEATDFLGLETSLSHGRHRISPS